MFAVCQLTESVLCNTHAVESVAVKDLLQLVSGLAVKLRICVIIGIIDERQGYYIKSRVKCRVDQIGMHGDLYRISVHQCLDSLGLISVCQLIRCVNIDFDFSAGCFLHKLTELTSSISPGACLCCRACKVPGCFRPVQITVILHGIYRILCKKIYQILCIVIACTLKLLYKPIVNSVYCFFEGIDIHILFLCKGHTVALLPATHDLLIAGTVDVTLILNSLLTCLINNLLLFRCQAVINILIDAEEQTVIDCIPHGAVRLYLLYAGCIDGR